jgi:hypothetical protein
MVLLPYSRTGCGLVFPRDRLDVHFVDALPLSAFSLYARTRFDSEDLHISGVLERLRRKLADSLQSRGYGVFEGETGWCGDHERFTGPAV